MKNKMIHVIYGLYKNYTLQMIVTTFDSIPRVSTLNLLDFRFVIEIIN